MTKLAVHGAVLRCSQGTAPGSLLVAPQNIDADDTPVATVSHHQPMVNIQPFGMCRSLANPQVAAATSAAMGTLTPQPCLPVIPARWAPGATGITMDGQPALSADSTCQCNWAGSIEIAQPIGQVELE